MKITSIVKLANEMINTYQEGIIAKEINETDNNDFVDGLLGIYQVGKSEPMMVVYEQDNGKYMFCLETYTPSKMYKDGSGDPESYDWLEYDKLFDSILDAVEHYLQMLENERNQDMIEDSYEIES